MRLILLCLVTTVCSAGIVKESSKDATDGQTRYFLFPADDGDHLYLVDSEEPVDKEFLKNYASDPLNIIYWLFTRENPSTPQILRMFDDQSVQNSNFNTSKTTVFLAHGWKNDANSLMIKILTEAFLQDDDANIIVLDWSIIAGKNYVTAKSGTAQAGKGLGQFINWLATLKLDCNKTHLVGFSLGAHLVGHAGRETGGRVKRITALDPAGPLINNHDRIDKTDGQYVEVIHTNSKFFGYAEPCGHADHYPNGGSQMPNCWFSFCSHGMAWKYMVATIRYNHLYANKCATIYDAQKNTCYGTLVPMGNGDLNKSRHGIFRVNTKKEFPF